MLRRREAEGSINMLTWKWGRETRVKIDLWRNGDYIYMVGRRHRTLHLYVVTATNLVFEVQIQSQRRDVAQRADRTWWWLWALRAVVKNFRMVRSWKPPLLALYNTTTTTLFSYPGHLYDPTWIYSIQYHPPSPSRKHQQPYINKWMSVNERANEQMSKYTAPPNPQGDRPRSMRSLAIIYQVLSSLDCDPRFSLSPFNGVVTQWSFWTGANMELQDGPRLALEWI